MTVRKLKKRGPKGPQKPMDDQMFNQLVAMVRIHCTQDEVCSVLNMGESTLDVRCKERGYKNFHDLFTQKRGEGKASLRRMQWKECENGNTAMLIWKGKQMLGERDKIENDVTVHQPEPFTGFEITRAKPD